MKNQIVWCPETTSRWAVGVMLAGFIEVGGHASEGPSKSGLVHAHATWSSHIALFDGLNQFIKLEQLLMHMTAEDRLTILYEVGGDPTKLQRDMVTCVDMPEIVSACRKQVNTLDPSLTQKIAAYLQSDRSVVGGNNYVPPSQALSKADCLEMLEHANILFVPESWFDANLVKDGFLTLQGAWPKSFHFWADAFCAEDPTKTYVVEGILCSRKDGLYAIYPKCDPGLISFWNAHAHIWNPVTDLRPISLVVDGAFPYPCCVREDAIHANVKLTNVRMLPLDENASTSSIGVRVSPAFGMSSIFVIPNVDGGLIRGEAGEFPCPQPNVLKQMLGLKSSKSADFWQQAANKIADLAITHEQRLLQIMGPPRIRMWPSRKAKVQTMVSSEDGHDAAVAEKRKFEAVPQAWRLAQSAGLDQDIPELGVWDPGAKWLANMLCMITAMRHLRSSTLFEDRYVTDLYDPKDLARALLTAPASDFHAIWLCRIMGQEQVTLKYDKQEIQGATLTESADAIFG